MHVRKFEVFSYLIKREFPVSQVEFCLNGEKSAAKTTVSDRIWEN